MKRNVLDRDRLEAFSDGVLAVIITIMVLELKVPVGGHLADLHPMIPTFLAYVLSFTYVAIYWNNHHHLLRASAGINGAVMWANLHLLFWLSLVPFVTAWLGEHRTEAVPTAVYGAVLLLAAAAYTILTYTLVAANGPGSLIARLLRVDVKQLLSLFLYACGIAAAFIAPWLSDVCYVVVALIWLVPDRRIERALLEEDGSETSA